MWIEINIETNNIECSTVIINLDKVESISNMCECTGQSLIELVVGKNQYSYFWKFDTEEECNAAFDDLKRKIITPSYAKKVNKKERNYFPYYSSMYKGCL